MPSNADSYICSKIGHLGSHGGPKKAKNGAKSGQKHKIIFFEY